MVRRNARVARWSALLASASLAFAACGSPGGTGTPAVTDDGAGGGAGTSPPATSPDMSPDMSPSGDVQGGTVSVIGTWGGDEQEAFLAMVEPFETETGIDVQYTGTRDLNAVLTTGVASGILPDLAGLPGPGQMAEFARGGALIDLSTVLDVETYESETAPAFVELGTVDDMLAGVFIKSAVKGLIWYNPEVYTGDAPATWEDLQAVATDPAEARWCVGLESGAASGWPGTDWIEDFVLRQSGPEVYDAWVAGEQAWTSPEIRQAFEAFGEVVSEESTFGGTNYVLTTNFGDAGNELFTDPPGCLFHHQASFITSFFVDQGGAEEGQFDFFPFPDVNPEYSGSLTGAGDLFGMFNDTPQARALIQYLVTPEAQQIWVDRGGALSGNTLVTEYPDEISQRSAELLVNAEIFRFDASDLMPEQMNNAFWTALLAYTPNPGNLAAILANLDTVQESAYEE
ncbi:ABC transporter substrate-binding protein [soil metagenome]